MKKRQNFYGKADEGSMKTLTFTLVIGIALMLTMGVTLAQQTQIQTPKENTGYQTIYNDCNCNPQRPDTGGLKAEGPAVCPLVISGMSEIQSLGESWYRAFLVQYIQSSYLVTDYNPIGDEPQYDPHQNASIQRHRVQGISQGISGVYTLPLSWNQLMINFEIIRAYSEGSGPMPSWWDEQENITFTSNCNSLSDCLIGSAGVDPYWAYVLMGFIAAGGNPYVYVYAVVENAQDRTAALSCLSEAGVL